MAAGAEAKPGAGSAQHAAATPPAAARVRALASNVNTVADVEDMVLTLGGLPSVHTAPKQASAGTGTSCTGVRPLAVVKVGGEVITKDADNLLASLRVLRDAGLLPVVVHGGGPQLNDELAKAGVAPQYIGGHRVTDAPTMAVAKRVFEAANAQLAGILAAGGLDVQPFTGGVFMAEVRCMHQQTGNLARMMVKPV